MWKKNKVSRKNDENTHMKKLYLSSISKPFLMLKSKNEISFYSLWRIACKRPYDGLLDHCNPLVESKHLTRKQVSFVKDKF